MAMKPPPGQRCECRDHLKDGAPLRRVFYRRQRDKKPCYEWWCTSCDADLGDDWEQPRDESGRFMPALRCQTVPGLD